MSRLYLCFFVAVVLIVSGCGEGHKRGESNNGDEQPQADNKDAISTQEPKPPSIVQVPRTSKSNKPAITYSIPLSVEEWDCSVAEKEWGIKLESVVKTKEQEWTLLFTLTKDLGYEPGLRDVFPPKGTYPGKPQYAWYLFDEDNVMIGEARVYLSEGKTIGAKGDAFRAVLDMSPWEGRQFKRPIAKVSLRRSQQR